MTNNRLTGVFYFSLLLLGLVGLAWVLLAAPMAGRALAPDLIFAERTLTESKAPRMVKTIDLNGDTYTDVVGISYGSSGKVSWWENDGLGGFTEHTVKAYDSGYAVDPFDLDFDGDIDIIASHAHEIQWLENDGDENFTEHDVDSDLGLYDTASDLAGADLDGDGDGDVVAYAGNDLRWWENDGSESFTEHTIDADLNQPRELQVIDLDGDDDLDVVGASWYDKQILWWENDGAESFTKHTIGADLEGADTVYAADLDGDNDLDVFGGAQLGDELAWWENDGGESFTKHLVDAGFDSDNVYAADIEMDGDLDILAVERYGRVTVWWNDGSASFTRQAVSDYRYGTYGRAADFDGDGDLDIVSGAAWWETGPPEVASFPYDNGFEEGTLGFEWVITSTLQGGAGVSTSNEPALGDYHLLLEDRVTDGTYSSAGAILTIDLSGQSDADLGFLWKNFDDDVHPNEGVFISADGETWAQVLTAPETIGEWVPVEVDLAAAAATHGMPFNAQYQIKFQFYDDDAIPDDGYAIDEVQVSDGITWRVFGLTARDDSPTGLASPTHLEATIVNGTDVTYTWSPGDGSTATGAAVSHVYPALGTYTAVVTASNATSLMTATTEVEIIPAVAISGLQADNDSPMPLGTPVDFSATIDAGTTVSYAWDLGDGNTASGGAVQHLYDEIGVYQAVVTATNTENTVSASTLVTITEMPECMHFDFDVEGAYMTFYTPVYANFAITHNMGVDTAETYVMLADDDSDAKTLHIQIRQNGESFYTCDPVVNTTLSYYRCSGDVAVDLLKGDTVTFYLYGSGSPQGIIGGPNTLELCSVTEDERVYLPIIIR